eukprot:scaffold28231_cov143-Skeletonema_menzelii.AAC.1
MDHHSRYQNSATKDDEDYYQRHPNVGGNNNSNNHNNNGFNGGMHRTKMEGVRDREQHQMSSNYNNVSNGGGGVFEGGMQQRNKNHNNNMEAPPPPSSRPHQVPPEGYVCRLCNIPGHWIQACPTNSNNNNNSGSFHGGGMQHRNASMEGSSHHHHQIPPEGYVCRLCNVPGHWIQVCPTKTMDQQQQQQRHSNSNNNMDSGRGEYSRLADTISSSVNPPPHPHSSGRMERRVPNYREESYQPHHHRFQEPQQKHRFEERHYYQEPQQQQQQHRFEERHHYHEQQQQQQQDQQHHYQEEGYERQNGFDGRHLEQPPRDNNYHDPPRRFGEEQRYVGEMDHFNNNVPNNHWEESDRRGEREFGNGMAEWNQNEGFRDDIGGSFPYNRGGDDMMGGRGEQREFPQYHHHQQEEHQEHSQRWRQEERYNHGGNNDMVGVYHDERNQLSRSRFDDQDHFQGRNYNEPPQSQPFHHESGGWDEGRPPYNHYEEDRQFNHHHHQQQQHQDYHLNPEPSTHRAEIHPSSATHFGQESSSHSHLNSHATSDNNVAPSLIGDGAATIHDLRKGATDEPTVPKEMPPPAAADTAATDHIIRKNHI